LGFVRVICLQGGVRIASSGVGVGFRGGTVRPSAVDASDLGDCSAAVVGVDYDFDGGDVGAPQDLLVSIGTRLMVLESYMMELEKWIRRIEVDGSIGCWTVVDMR
jgi:hypothetical protein